MVRLTGAGCIGLLHALCCREMVPLAIGRLNGTLLEVAGNVGCGKRRFVDDLIAHIKATRLKVSRRPLPVCITAL